jgi:hypothetical protein
MGIAANSRRTLTTSGYSVLWRLATHVSSACAKAQVALTWLGQCTWEWRLLVVWVGQFDPGPREKPSDERVLAAVFKPRLAKKLIEAAMRVGGSSFAVWLTRSPISCSMRHAPCAMLAGASSVSTCTLLALLGQPPTTRRLVLVLRPNSISTAASEMLRELNPLLMRL